MPIVGLPSSGELAVIAHAREGSWFQMCHREPCHIIWIAHCRLLDNHLPRFRLVHSVAAGRSLDLLGDATRLLLLGLVQDCGTHYSCYSLSRFILRLRGHVMQWIRLDDLLLRGHLEEVFGFIQVYLFLWDHSQILGDTLAACLGFGLS